MTNRLALHHRLYSFSRVSNNKLATPACQQMFEWLNTFRDWLSGGHSTPYIKQRPPNAAAETEEDTNAVRPALRLPIQHVAAVVERKLSHSSKSHSTTRTHPFGPCRVDIELIGSVCATGVSVTKRFTRRIKLTTLYRMSWSVGGSLLHSAV